MNCFSMRNLQNQLVLIHGIPIYNKNYQNVKQYVILYLIVKVKISWRFSDGK